MNRPAARPVVALVGGITLLALASPALAGSRTGSVPPLGSTLTTVGSLVHVCAAPLPGEAACDAIRLDPASKASPQATAVTPKGYGPADLASAYSLPASGGSGQTIAIVDAYDDPNAEKDLAVYRSTYGLPACTSATGCFTKVGQSGTSTLPKTDAGWAQEESLDLDMASAVCPACKILLVEATSPTTANLGASVNTAAKLGATVISNSYGGSESSSDATYDSQYYNHPGIAITASSGDGGYGVEYPAASQYVTAVGGTALTKDTTTARGWTEKVWSTSATEGAGSGCSKVDVQPSWQKSNATITKVCAKRAVADVAAVADPATGVAVYDSLAYQGTSGWMTFGGTSVAAPVVAGVYALAGNAKNVTYGSFPYSHTSSLNDVTAGKTSTCGSVLCAAGTGWDGPTGLGTPKGTGAF